MRTDTTDWMVDMNERQKHKRRVREHLREAKADPARPPHEDGYHYRILGIHEMRSDQTFQFTSVRISKDDPRLDDKLVMVQMAKDIMTQALAIDGYDPALSLAIRAAIQSEPPVFHWLGELFQNYGMFQEKHKVYGTEETRKKLECLLRQGECADDAWYDDYRGRGTQRRVPLPFAVRNMLAHPDIEGEITYAQIKLAIEILADLVRGADG